MFTLNIYYGNKKKKNGDRSEFVSQSGAGPSSVDLQFLFEYSKIKVTLINL